MNRKEFESRIIGRALRDAAFRKRLIERTREVMAEELSALGEDATLPSDLRVTVLQETASRKYIVLPRTMDTLEDGTLTMEELGDIAGGTAFSVFVLVYTAAFS
ncbi:MAG: NHLP leader peptide family natural product precursor [Candidatus Schekmanbacteria bacterium]|nr:NHLP leader peptide family natural product precursor [Candidatus Schekmanbacteria bacterium]